MSGHIRGQRMTRYTWIQQYRRHNSTHNSTHSSTHSIPLPYTSSLHAIRYEPLPKLHQEPHPSLGASRSHQQTPALGPSHKTGHPPARSRSATAPLAPGKKGDRFHFLKSSELGLGHPCNVPSSRPFRYLFPQATKARTESHWRLTNYGRNSSRPLSP